MKSKIKILMCLKDDGFQVVYNLKSRITVSVMCQEMSVKQGIMTKEAVEQRVYIMAPFI